MTADLPFGVPSRVPGGAWTMRVPEPAPRQYDEAKLQRAVHRYLGLALPHDATHFAIPNGLMRSKRAAARAKGEGVKAGVCDLCVIWRGHAYFIELKTPRGQMSMAQRAMRDLLLHCGAAVMVCRSVEEVERALREATVPLRASVMA